MIAFLVFIVVLALPPVWLFARTRPPTQRLAALRRFNALAWFAALFLGSCAWIVSSNRDAGINTPMIAIVAGVAVGSSTLLVAALLRFLVFRRRP